MRVAFALDCCAREAMGHVATTGGITAEDVQDLMVATVEHRFGPVNRLPEPIEWLSGNGSCYVARDTRAFARDIGLEPCTTPVSSPQSNGIAEAFVRTLKRDYVRVNFRPDAQTVIEQLPGWLAHYNEVHRHRALGYRSPREYIAQTREAPSGLSKGQQQFDLTVSRLWVRRFKNSLSVEQPIAGDELRAVKHYLATRDNDLPWLFVSERATQLTRQAVNYLLARLRRARACGRSPRTCCATRATSRSLSAPTTFG